MKKIIIVLGCFMTFGAGATEMCARNDTIVVPLDATVTGNGNGYNAVEWMWWATFEYGKIYGTATCLSPAEVTELLPSDDDELLGRSGKDATAESEGTADNRTQCYCKLTHPMSSRWVFSSRIPPLIARPFARTTALTTPTTMSVCGPGCSGPSARRCNGSHAKNAVFGMGCLIRA